MVAVDTELGDRDVVSSDGIRQIDRGISSRFHGEDRLLTETYCRREERIFASTCRQRFIREYARDRTTIADEVGPIHVVECQIDRMQGITVINGNTTVFDVVH